MRIFDRVDPADLDRREWQLWLLAFAVIAILAAGTALLMYPSAFSVPVVLSGQVLRRVFLGFCALSVLLVAYFVDRQMTIRKLRREVEEEREIIKRIHAIASADLLRTLPGPGHFQDRLAMEFRRAVSAGQPLSAVLIVLRPESCSTDEVSFAFGDAAKALQNKLRGEDSIFLLSAGVFCILLPGVEEVNAHGVSKRLDQGLQDAAGVTPRFSFDIQTFSYPEGVQSAREIEDALRSYLRRDHPRPPFAVQENIESNKEQENLQPKV